MEYTNTARKFIPFVSTQIYEHQNCFLIFDPFLRKNFEEFNQKLYRYIDKRLADSSFYRLFRIEEKVALIYYWKTDLEEPRSHRKGIYLITGVLCDYSEFCASPLELHWALNALLEAIAQKYRSDDGDRIMKTVWMEYAHRFPEAKHDMQSERLSQGYSLPMGSDFDREKQETGFEQIEHDFQSAKYKNHGSNPPPPIMFRIGSCRLHLCLPSSALSDIPRFFVSEAASWMCHPWGKTDIASKEGFGDCFIDVHLNDRGIPPDISRVKLLKRFGMSYLEIRT